MERQQVESDVGEVSTTDLLAQIVTDTNRLVGQEIELGKLQVRQELRFFISRSILGLSLGATVLAGVVLLGQAGSLALVAYTPLSAPIAYLLTGSAFSLGGLLTIYLAKWKRDDSVSG